MFIHDALSELVVCGETEVTAADLRIVMNQLKRQAVGETTDITGYQKQFQVRSGKYIWLIESVCVCCVCVSLSDSGEGELPVPGQLPRG